MGKRLSASLLACTMLLCGCAETVDSDTSKAPRTSLEEQPVLVGNIPCEFPLVKQKTSLNCLMVGAGDIPAEDVYVWKKYKEMTGVGVNWTTVAKAERSEAIYTALVNKTDLDLIMRGKISAEKLTQYGESGLILDLAKDDLLKNNAPNCWAFLQSHPEALASITNPDGTIYSLPQVNAGPELSVARKLFINKTWLENVGMDVPTTTDELYALLQAFKTQDPNGNGDPNDEIPFCPMDWASVQDVLFGAFGLGNRGMHEQMVDYDEENNDVRLIASAASYKAFLEYIHKLYAEGLIDKYMFSIQGDQWTNNAKNDRVGVFAFTNLATVPAEQADNWVAVEDALTGPAGDKLWASIRGNFHSTGAAVLPATCDDPALVLRWLDYFWTDAGTLFYHLGTEGETYTTKDDGTYDYLPSIYEEIKTSGKSFDQVIAQYSPYPGGSNPTVEIAPYFMGGEMAEIPARAARKLYTYGPAEYWPSFTFTKEENETLSICKSDITKYCDTARKDFITGAKPFSEWDTYTAQLKQLGEEKLLRIYRAAVNRYHTMIAQHEKAQE